MVLGVGVDILNIDRIRGVLGDDRDPFFRKAFTRKEREQAAGRSDPAAYYAACFAGKEAVFKCLGMKGDGIRLDDIEILPVRTGQHRVTLSGRFKKLAVKRGIKDFSIALSSNGGYTVALAIAQGH